MQYFLIEAETKDPLPEIINWYGKINPRHVNEKDFHKITEWTMLDARVNKDTVFPDILSDPFFLLSKNAAKVVGSYEPGIKMVGVKLFSCKNRINLPYLLPILPVVNCLSNQSEFINGNIGMSRCVIIEAMTDGRALFQLAGLEEQHVVIRLDLLESLLRREALSIRIREVEVI